MEQKAYFVRFPHKAEEITIRNRDGGWFTYEIVGSVSLDAIDFENFTADLAADRRFLASSHTLCAREDKHVRCLLVTRVGEEGGILAVPTKDQFVEWAAFYDPEQPQPPVQLVEEAPPRG